MEKENIKLNQKTDDIKLQQMLDEMNVEIQKQKIIEAKEREERQKRVEEDLKKQRQGNVSQIRFTLLILTII